MKTREMTCGSPLRLLLSVSLPLMIGNVFQQLYTVVDAQVVGSVDGVSSLAALGAADWFIWLFMGIVSGFAQGFTIPMAQAFGAKDHALLRKTVGNAVLLAVACSAALMAVSLSLIHPLLTLLGTPEEIMPLSKMYLTILFCGMPIVMAYNMMAGVLRSLGDGQSPLYAMIVASLVNIVLDLLFVAVFRWGIMGAAVATAIAQCCSVIFCLFRLRKVKFIHPARSDFRPDRALCSRLMRLSIPVAIQNGVIGVGGLVVQSVVNTMGVAFIAGYTASNKLYGVLEIAAISFGYAISTYCGQNLGAKRYDRIREGVRTGAVLGVATAAVIAAVMFVFGGSIVASFISGTPEEVSEATRIAREYLYLMAAGLPVLYLLYNYRSSLQGMGNTVAPMISGTAELVMRTASALFLPALIGYSGIFWGEVLAWLGADLILMPNYFILMRKLRREGK